MDAFAVATLEEAMELRRNGIDGIILIFGHIRVDDLPLASKHHLTLSVNHRGWLEEAIQSYAGDPIDLHVKVDTGMHRLGILTPEEFRTVLDLIKAAKGFRLSGIYSHLAASETNDERYYQYQMSQFATFLQDVDLTGLAVHIANSGGSVKAHPNFITMVRIGLFLHGVQPGKDMKLAFPLKPTLSLFTSIVQVKHLPRGSKLSYNGLYETRAKDEIIATIPIGYADGFDRRLENARVYVDNEYAPIVGRICMDYAMIRLARDLPVGTRVELIGEHVTADEFAIKCKTNTYQVFCQLSDRLPRIYYQNGTIVDVVNRRFPWTNEEE
ncbi:MAG: alanine racemase [Bacillus subtilis]|nr:alanine racemase [Bacillus subtilis]